MTNIASLVGRIIVANHIFEVIFVLFFVLSPIVTENDGDGSQLAVDVEFICSQEARTY